MAIITALAVIAIIISGLGLYGLSTFTVQKRSKEISIRKVMEANPSGLIFLLTRQYLHLVFLAFVITIPLTYYLLNQWLENFAYHISINASTYAISGLVIAVFTLLIIIFHTYKSTQQNPVREGAAEPDPDREVIRGSNRRIALLYCACHGRRDFNYSQPTGFFAGSWFAF